MIPIKDPASSPRSLTPNNKILTLMTPRFTKSACHDLFVPVDRSRVLFHMKSARSLFRYRPSCCLVFSATFLICPSFYIH